MQRIVALCAVFFLVLAACGGGEADDSGGTDDEIIIDNDGGSGNTPSDDAGSGGDGADGASGSDGDGGDDDGTTGPDTDDFGDIVGNPDLDADDLPGQAGDLADAVDDIVSLGDCEAFGLRAMAPEGMQCRVLDGGFGGLEGFTMFDADNDLNISIGSPNPIGEPCELLQACDETEPIELSDNFPDTVIYEIFGLVNIWGNHANGAELVITNSEALTDEELQLIMDVLDSVVETG